MEDLAIKIEQQLYTLLPSKVKELGEFLKVDICDQPEKGRRYKIKKLREGFETIVEEHDEENLKTFLEDVWRIVSEENSGADESPVVGEKEASISQGAEQAIQITEKPKEVQGKASSSGGGTISELVNLRRDFKISGTISGESQRDRLSFVGLMRQIDNGLAKGYKESEMIDAVIRAISPSSKLKTYLEIMAEISLQKLRQIIRVHYREKSSTELYQELTTLVQDQKESPQDFLLRALALRERVTFASKAEDALKYDATLVQSLFTHAVETGLRDEVIRSKIRFVLKPESSDEELMETLNKIVSVEGERQLKLGSRKEKASVASVSEDKGAKIKQKEMSNVMSTLEALQLQIAELNAKFEASKPQSQQAPRNSQPHAGETRNTQRFRRRCGRCEESNAMHCNHCFKCGSEDHLARGCIKSMPSGNGMKLRPRDGE